MLPPDTRVVDYEPGSDQAYWDIVRACFGNVYGDLEFWRGKHVRRPGFDPRDVKRVYVGQVPAACYAASTAWLCLGRELFVPASIEGDVAVLPEFRGKGLTLLAHAAMGEELYSRGLALRVGLATRALHTRFYGRRFGHVAIPTTNIRYQKRLRQSTQLAQVVFALANSFRKRALVRRLVRRVPLTVLLRFQGYSPVMIRLEQASATLIAPREGVPDLILSVANQAVRAASGSWKSRLARFPLCVMRGQVRVHGMAAVLRRLV